MAGFSHALSLSSSPVSSVACTFSTSCISWFASRLNAEVFTYSSNKLLKNSSSSSIHLYLEVSRGFSVFRRKSFRVVFSEKSPRFVVSSKSCTASPVGCRLPGEGRVKIMR